MSKMRCTTTMISRMTAMVMIAKTMRRVVANMTMRMTIKVGTTRSKIRRLVR